MKNGIAVSTLLVILICALSISVPTIDGENVNSVTCNGVTLTVIDDNIEMRSSEADEVHIHIHNSNTMAVTVRISSPDGAVIKAEIAEKEISVASGKTVDTVCILSTDRYTDKGTYDVSVVLSVMDGINPLMNETLHLDVTVISQYSINERFNKFFGIFENNLESPFNQPWFTALVTLIAWIFISFAVGYASVKIIQYLLEAFKMDGSLIGRYTLYGIGLIVLTFGIANSMYVFGVKGEVLKWFLDACDYVYVLFGAMIVWDLYETIVFNALSKKTDTKHGLDASLIPLFNLIGKIVIVTVSVAMILSLYGLSLAGVLAGAGIAGLGISLGVKPAVSQLISGITVLLTRPFKVGDMVKIGNDSEYCVVKVGIMMTELKSDYTKENIVMPNSKIASSTITNLTYRTRYYRKTLDVKIPFDVDIELAKNLMIEAACENTNVAVNDRVPKPCVTFKEFKDKSGMVMHLAFYVFEYGKAGATAGQIRESILKRFYENGIKIPMEKYEFSIMNENGEPNEN